MNRFGPRRAAAPGLLRIFLRFSLCATVSRHSTAERGTFIAAILSGVSGVGDDNANI